MLFKTYGAKILKMDQANTYLGERKGKSKHLVNIFNSNLIIVSISSQFNCDILHFESKNWKRSFFSLIYFFKDKNGKNIYFFVLFTSRWHPELIKYGLRGLLETPSVSQFKGCVCVCLVTVMSDSLPRYGLQHARLLCPQGFSRQEYWSGLPCPPPRDLPNPGIEPRSPTLQVDSLLSEPPDKPNSKDAYSLYLLHLQDQSLQLKVM